MFSRSSPGKVTKPHAIACVGRNSPTVDYGRLAAVFWIVRIEEAYVDFGLSMF
jgi:hypothetical protein